jgi:hypothetical protein
VARGFWSGLANGKGGCRLELVARSAGVVEEVQPLFLAGANDRLDGCGRCRAAVFPIRPAVGASVAAAPDVTFALVVVRRNVVPFEEQQLEPKFGQAIADPPAVRLFGPRIKQPVETVFYFLPPRGERLRRQLFPQSVQFPQQMHQALLLERFQSTVPRVEVGD